MAFTELYATESGSNQNGGSGGTAITRSGWMSAADTFAGTSIDLSGVSAGQMCQIAPSGTSLSGRVARVTAVDDSADTITLSSSASMNTSGGGICAFVSGNGANNGTTVSDLCGNTITRDGTGSYTSTAQSKYGGSSIYCPGLYTSGFRIAHAASQQFGSGPFTLACWVRLVDKEKTVNSCIQKYGSADGTRAYGFGIGPTSGGSNRLWFTYTTAGNTASQVDLWQPATIANNTWYYITLVRSANTLYWFLDGTLLGTTAFSASIFASTADICIGRYGTFSGSTIYDDLALNGWISGILVANTALWTSSFTPPTSHVTATVGGSWLSPTGSTYWPLNQSGLTSVTNSAGDRPRLNISGTSVMSTAIISATSTPMRIEGFSSTAGDGGHWSVTNSGSNNAFTLSTAAVELRHVTMTSTAASGTGSGVSITADSCSVTDCEISGWRGMGVDIGSGGNNVVIADNMITDCGKSNTSGYAAIRSSSGIHHLFERNRIYSNSGANIDGIRVTRTARVRDNIITANGRYGVYIAAAQNELYEVVNNIIESSGSHGITVDTTSSTSGLTIVASNNVVLANAGTGIYGTGSYKRRGVARNNAFRGNAATTSGLDCVEESGSVTLTAAPYDASYGLDTTELVGAGYWSSHLGIANSRNIGPIYESGGAGVFPVIGSAIIRVMGVTCA